MKILAIDLGDVRTGLAICDPGEMLASPLCVIEQRSRDKLAKKLADIAVEHSVGEIVMGYPKNMDGSEGSRAQIYTGFAEKLRRANGVFARDHAYTGPYKFPEPFAGVRRVFAADADEYAVAGRQNRPAGGVVC